MQTDSTVAGSFSWESSSIPMERFAPERLQLLQDLETSLQGSRRALLALDLAAIEQGTREQVGLVRELQGFSERKLRIETAPEIESAEIKATGIKAAEIEIAGTKIVEDIRRAEQAVLQAARVQAALLARAQRKLRILANMLAGPSLHYQCLFAQPNVPTAVVYGTQAGDF
jgi:hypothetical protein